MNQNALAAARRFAEGLADVPDTSPAPAQGRCTYAFPGTYGHECGKPALFAGMSESTTGTKSGVFFNLRCASCRTETGSDNRGITAWEPYDPTRHVNEWSKT